MGADAVVLLDSPTLEVKSGKLIGILKKEATVLSEIMNFLDDANNPSVHFQFIVWQFPRITTILQIE